MPVRLQRKARRNKIRAAQRRATMKRLLFMPVIKCVDRAAIRKSFEDNKTQL